MSATCPACGVAVVPGYVKCPKCHTALPRTKTSTKGAGGTAVPATVTVPWVPIAVTVVVAGGIILFFALRKGGSAKAEPPPGPAPTVPNSPTAPTPAPTPTPDIVSPTLTPQQTGPSRNDVAKDLRHALEQRRLWSTVTVTGANVEVRGTSCGDKQMPATIDAIAAAAKAAGLTRLRCVEQSGAVVFTRDF